MAANRDILRAVRDYQRPLHNPDQIFTTARTMVVEGVTLTIETKKLVVRTLDKPAQDDLNKTLSIL